MVAIPAAQGIEKMISENTALGMHNRVTALLRLAHSEGDLTLRIEALDILRSMPDSIRVMNRTLNVIEATRTGLLRLIQLAEHWPEGIPTRSALAALHRIQGPQPNFNPKDQINEMLKACYVNFTAPAIGLPLSRKIEVSGRARSFLRKSDRLFPVQS